MAASEIIRPGRKLPQVLDGARRVFLEQGYAGASVDDIARAAGVSKATLYSYVADKRLLFLEVARIECRRQSDATMAEIDPSEPPRAVLTQAAWAMARFFTSPVGLQIFRMVVAEAPRFPELGREYYAWGPGMVRHLLADYLAAAVARADLAIDDVDLAAEQFPELCRAGLHTRTLLGIDAPPDEAELARTVDGAVDMFLARYGA